MSILRWFGFGTSGQNQTFGSIQTRSVMLIFISSFKILIIFNSGRIKQTCATLVFRKILTLLRMWRHHSASLQKYSKVKYIKERQSPYLGFVFYFKSISCLGFAWEHDKKDTFSQYFKFRQMPILVYIIWVTKPQGLVRRSSLWLLFYFRCIYFLSSLLYMHCLFFKNTSVKKHGFLKLKSKLIGR